MKIITIEISFNINIVLVINVHAEKYAQINKWRVMEVFFSL